MSSKNLLSQAQIKLKAKKNDEAEALLLDLLKQKPLHAEAFFLLGNLYHGQGKFDRAAASYKKALKLKPNYTEAGISLSILYNDLGRYEEGRLIFNRLRQQISTQETVEDSFLDEQLSQKHTELGDLYAAYRRYDEAEVEYKKALKLLPHHPEAVIKLAKLYENKGATDQTLKELKSLVSEKPEYLPGRIKLGLAFYAQGHMIDAIRQWEKVLDYDKHHSEALMYLKMAEQATTTQV